MLKVRKISVIPDLSRELLLVWSFMDFPAQLGSCGGPLFSENTGLKYWSERGFRRRVWGLA